MADMEVYKRKFHKEATTIAALNHSNIIKIYDVFDENNTSCYAMEYIEGCSLRDMVQRGGALSRGCAQILLRAHSSRAKLTKLVIAPRIL